MTIADSQTSARLVRPERSLAVAATFTAEPIREALEFWMEELNVTGSIQFAPYNQVFQALLDPSSVLSQNRKGVNIALVRLEDWQRLHSGAGSTENLEECLTRNAVDLIDAVRAATSRLSTPLILCFCPSSPTAWDNQPTRDRLASLEERIASALHGLPGLCTVRSQSFQEYPVDDYYDPQRDQLGQVPYTPVFYAAMATMLARRIHALSNPPYKVVVLDCDNTLWKGAVGEEGVMGISIPPAYSQLQQFMVKLSVEGFLLALCSKNDESDVLDVFVQRQDMILKQDHLIAWRINWQAKSSNIRSLAQELNLGLDSFVFLDDNPIECAEVQAGCPEVLALRLPVEGDIVHFLKHVWAFDRLDVTSEDQQRTAMYRKELERGRFQKQTLTIEEFVAGLDLQVEISEPKAHQIQRIAQLTQRTNQFNFTSKRRSDSEIRQLANLDLECLAVEVTDRFGEYGLVGVLIFSNRANVLEIDTFLLSCRVLGRGVEHRMLNKLGAIADKRQLPSVRATLICTKKNQPARSFLDNVAADWRREVDGGWQYDIPTARAVSVGYTREAKEEDAEPVLVMIADSDQPGDSKTKSERAERIACTLSAPTDVTELLAVRRGRKQTRAALAHAFVAPQTEIEGALAEIWADVLRFDLVGVHDDFFGLGGTSLLAVDLCARIERCLGKRLPLTSLIEAPTVAKLAHRMTKAPQADSVVLIRDGKGKPPLFLIHDGDGETMLYRNLAMLLSAEYPVFGLQPYSHQNVPIAHTRISDMATYHTKRIQSIQPQGPYMVGGMCAGGVIAFEVARQLQSEGQKVVLVALIDAADVAATQKIWRAVSTRGQRFLSILHQDGSVSFHRRVRSILTRAGCKLRNLIAYVIRDRLESATDSIRMRLFRFCLDRGLHLPQALQRITVRTVYRYAEQDYEPKGSFEGELVLFRATRGTGTDEPYIERYNDPLFGWGRRATRGVRTYDVPGGHSSMLQEPHVRTLAGQMQAYIDEVLRDKPAATGLREDIHGVDVAAEVQVPQEHFATAAVSPYDSGNPEAVL